MAGTKNLYDTSFTIYWPTRACLTEGQFNITRTPWSGRPCSIKVSYHNVLNVGGELFASNSWTRLDIGLQIPFNGQSEDFRRWAASAGGIQQLCSHAQRVQNFFLDHLKAFAPHNRDIDNLRHFGPADWPFFEIAVGGYCFARVNPAVRAEIAAVRLSPVMPDLESGKDVPVTVRAFHRACDLVQCGYPTEGVLVGFALLDATVQGVLLDGMRGHGISDESARDLLRNTTQSRLATYLDPVLKLAWGTSLRESNLGLFKELIVVNGIRNATMHRGEEIGNVDSARSLICIFKVLEFLCSIGATRVIMPATPVFIDFF